MKDLEQLLWELEGNVLIKEDIEKILKLIWDLTKGKEK